MAEDRKRLAELDGHMLDGLRFCSKVYAFFKAIRKTKEGPSRFRMRPTKIEKKLLEELLPICKYVQASYRPGRYISVRWIDGSQTYDAEIAQRGEYVSKHYYPARGFIEVVCIMHPNEYLIREVLEKKGVAFGPDGIRRLKGGEIESTPMGYTNREFIASYSNLVLEQITKKAAKRYPENTTLIADCTPNTIYTPDEWAELIALVTKGLPDFSFREIYMYEHLQQHSHTFYPFRRA